MGWWRGSWWIVCLTVLAGAGHADARQAATLPTAEASYAISWMGIDAGRSDLSLTRLRGHRYRLRLETRAVGALQALYPLRHVAETELSIVANRVRPLALLSITRLWGAPKQRNVLFQWRKQRLLVQEDGREISIPLTDRWLQDRVSLVAAVMVDLAADRLRGSYALFDGKKVRELTLVSAGTDTIDTALGRLDTVRIERRPDDGPAETRVWLAPALGYLPVRVVHGRGSRPALRIEIQSAQMTTAPAE